ATPSPSSCSRATSWSSRAASTTGTGTAARSRRGTSRSTPRAPELPMSQLREMARFVRELSFSDLPDEVVEKAKQVSLNSLGVQLAASTLPWSKAAYRFGRSQGGPPEATVVNYGLRTTAANAAFVNGCFGHGFEMDDNHGRTGIKGGCVTVPTALAVGEW